MNAFSGRQGDRGSTRRGDECRGDLIARERRGELSGTDCLALRAHLADCGSCRLARQVFVDLDDVSGVDLRDGVRIERMTTAAKRWSHHRGRPASRLGKGRPRWRALGLAAALLFVGGSASATVWWWNGPAIAEAISAFAFGDDKDQQRPGRVRARAVARGAVASAGATAEPREVVPVVPEPAPPSLSPTVAQTPGGVEAPRRRSRHAASASASRVGGLSQPALLLRQASNSRRAGDADGAMALYRKLQHAHPKSSEAVLSAVALGGLLLERGLPRAALAQFDSYLGSSRGGALIPEALYGRGRALASLGDRKEERQTWDRLLTDFPNSAYSPLARRRLAHLK